MKMANPSTRRKSLMNEDSADSEDSGTGSRFRVLVLHGGGIHGVSTAAYLADLEKHSGSEIREHFDLIVGTSTGGIVAVALALGIPAIEVEGLYREHGKDIFSRRMPFLPRRIAKYFGPLYGIEPLCKLLMEIFGPDTELGEAKCPLCVPAINITTGRNVVFKTRHRAAYERDHKLEIWRVAAATAAAPVYFPPVKISDRGWFVDGGLWANAPIEVGIAEGRKLGYSLDQIEVLSVGTGEKAFQRSGAPHQIFRNARHGIIGWGQDLVDLVMRSQSQRSQDLARYLLSEEQILHVDFPLPNYTGGLDAVEEVDTLANRARTQAKKNSQGVRKRFFRTKKTDIG